MQIYQPRHIHNICMDVIVHSTHLSAWPDTYISARPYTIHFLGWCRPLCRYINIDTYTLSTCLILFIIHFYQPGWIHYIHWADTVHIAYISAGPDTLHLLRWYRPLRRYIILTTYTYLMDDTVHNIHLSACRYINLVTYTISTWLILFIKHIYQPG